MKIELPSEKAYQMEAQFVSNNSVSEDKQQQCHGVTSDTVSIYDTVARWETHFSLGSKIPNSYRSPLKIYRGITYNIRHIKITTYLNITKFLMWLVF